LRNKIQPTGTTTAVKITQLINNTVLLVDGSDISEKDLGTIFSKTESHAYDVIKRVDQKVLYEKVLDKLASGGSIGIFPEGGSYDRTDLLHLKVGVALIAYSALENDGLNVPIRTFLKKSTGTWYGVGFMKSQSHLFELSVTAFAAQNITNCSVVAVSRDEQGC
jgi:hypothetical protein